MLIQEMLDFNQDNNHKVDLGFDLKDDLKFFMNNDPTFYRKKYFPTMLKFNEYHKHGKQVSPRGFESLVKEAYGIYKNMFPVEGLDKELDKEICEKICLEIHEEELKNCKDKFYDLED